MTSSGGPNRNIFPWDRNFQRRLGSYGRIADFRAGRVFFSVQKHYSCTRFLFLPEPKYESKPLRGNHREKPPIYGRFRLP